jgi:hypothetical protein
VGCDDRAHAGPAAAEFYRAMEMTTWLVRVKAELERIASTP